jgi:hypothetical protein
MVLLVLGLATLGLVLIAFPIQPVPDTGHPGDLNTYSRVIERLQQGEPYHEALHAELLAGGYGTRSVFNWRPPFFMTIVAIFPSPAWAQVVVVTVAALGLVLAAVLVRREGASLGMMTGFAALLGLSLLAVLAPGVELACELAAGALILLSVSAYGLRLNWLGFAAALLALFTREIAAVYILICVVMAVQARRRGELVAWGVGLAGFIAYYYLHASAVLNLIGPEDRAYPEGWLQWGGAAFILATASFNGVFLLLPTWLSALYLPLMLLGLLASPARAMVIISATVLAFIALFAMFGKPVNAYWGALYTPLLAFGAVWVGPALRDLWRAAWA